MDRKGRHGVARFPSAFRMSGEPGQKIRDGHSRFSVGAPFRILTVGISSVRNMSIIKHFQPVRSKEFADSSIRTPAGSKVQATAAINGAYPGVGDIGLLK